MSGSAFVFPPPPPPPQASTSYPSYPTNPQQNGYGGREHRGGRESSRRGAGNTRRGSRGNNIRSGGGSSRADGHSLTRNDGYSSQTSYNAAGGYPLPEYPSVQQPQYPPNVHQGYGHTPSPYPAIPSYPTHQHGPPPFYDGAAQTASYGYHPPPQSAPYPPPQQQNRRAMDRNRDNSGGQPVLMGPPIRLGFDSGYPLDTHRSPILAQSYPQLAEDRARPFYNNSREGNRPPYRQNSPGNSRFARIGSPNSFQGQRNRGQKRGHADAFGGSRKNNPKSQVAPAIPSFGIPLPTKPPAPQEPGRKRKKKRRHNQLGLTPRAEEHESSGEEDDVDEETKLAAAVGPSSEEQQLQFTYKGRTATLQSSAEITAFIEERKKRFPTKERIEQATRLKREKQEAQRAAEQARKKALEKQKAEFREKQNAEARETKEKQKLQAETEAAESRSNNAVAKAKSKVEKLRRRLEKQEKRIAKAEARASKANTNHDKDEQLSLQNLVDTEGKPAGNSVSANGTTVDGASQIMLDAKSLGKTEEASSSVEEDAPKIKMEVDEVSKTTVKSEVIEEKILETLTGVPDPLTPTSQPSLPDRDTMQTNIQQSSIPGGFSALADPHRKPLIDGCIPESGEKVEESSLPVSATTSDDSDSSLSTDSDSEDSTSSSGSSSDNDAPETAPSTRVAPSRVPPPKKPKQKAICRDFLKSGRCRRGDACPFRHELPERGSQAANRRKDGKKAEVKTERKGLYQRLVDQEEEEEDMNILAAIVHLGERGMLQEEVLVENDAQVKDFGASGGNEGVETVT